MTSSTENIRRPNKSGFVADGAERLAAAIRTTVVPSIQAAVEYEYADRLARAGFFRRMWLRRCMRAEIKGRVEQEIGASLPPDDTLY